MSHARPDTCAFEYTDAFRHASGFGVAKTVEKRNLLIQRLRLAHDQGYSTALLDAALRGYDDWLEFNATHAVVQTDAGCDVCGLMAHLNPLSVESHSDHAQHEASI